MTAFVRGATLSNYAEVAAQVGLEPVAMLRRYGIDPRVLADSEAHIPIAQVADLLEASAAAANCPTFGLQMAESRRLSDLGAVSLLITHQATMRDALVTIAHYRQLVNESLIVQLEDHADIVVVREELLMPDRGALRQSHELAVGVLYRMFRAVLGIRWRAETVNFIHAPPPDLTVHRRVFGPICEFGSEFDGLTCRRGDLDAPNPSADPMLARLAERYILTLPNAERQSLRHEVQKAVYLLLPGGQASIRRVAESLALNERTLQRRLAAEGLEFAGLLNEVRRELALRYVANPQTPLARIAGLVGYGRQSSFNRWFSGEFGAAPTRWRQSGGHRGP